MVIIASAIVVIVIMPAVIVVTTAVFILPASLLPAFIIAPVAAVLPVVPVIISTTAITRTKAISAAIATPVSDHQLIMPVAVTGILVTIIVKMSPWFAFVHHYFVTCIQVIVAATPRQRGSVYPIAAIKVNKLAAGYAVVGFYIGQVIIFGIIVTGRSPFRLHTNVYINTYLCTGGVNYKKASG